MEIIEPLNGGLVTTRESDELMPGEIQAGVGFWFVPRRNTIVQAPVFSVSTLTSGIHCFGLAQATFDNGNNWLLAGMSDKYQYATVDADGNLGSWTTIATYATSTARNAVNAVHYNNKYYLFDGVQDNKVLRNDGTLRAHGLKPVNIALPSIVTATASANVWPANATGYFDYWYTEVFKSIGSIEDIVIESAYEATTTDSNLTNPASPGVNVSGPNGESARILLASVQVTALSTQATLSLPGTPINSSATHYRVYRSAAKAAQTDTSFPNGVLIAEVGIPSAQSTQANAQSIAIIDGAVTTSNYFYPSSIATATGWTASASAVDGSANYSNDTPATRTITVTTAPIATAELSTRTFNAPSVVTNEPVSQLEVNARVKATSIGCEVKAQVSFDGGVSWSANVVLGTTSTSYTELSSGMRTWGRTSISREDLLDANFYVRLTFTATSRTSLPQSTLVSLDGIRCRANYNGTGNVAAAPYPGIVLVQGKVSYVTSRNGEPPKARIGTIFQGSLVTDDSNNPSNIRWSMPGDPEAFPTLYYLPIETAKNDSITWIGTVNNVCIVGLKNAIVRLNYLPSEDDASFNRTKIYDFISTNHGILNSKAAATFLTPGGRELLACLSQDGIYVTDGFTITRWDQDVSLQSTAYSDIISSNNSLHDPRFIQLINDVSSENILVAWLTQDSDLRVQPFCYSSVHIKEGPRFKVGAEWTPLNDASSMAMCNLTTSAGLPIIYFAKNATFPSTTSEICALINLGSLSYTTNDTSYERSITSRDIIISRDLGSAVVHKAYLYGTGSEGVSIQITNVSPNENQSTSSAVAFPQSYNIAAADLEIAAHRARFRLVVPQGTTGVDRYSRVLLVTEDFDASPSKR